MLCGSIVCLAIVDSKIDVVFCCIVFGFFFFKQKTAYEMRISDWSSDVCSSDLLDLAIHVPVDDLGHVCSAPGAAEGGALPHASGDELERAGGEFLARFGDAAADAFTSAAVAAFERGPHTFGTTGRHETLASTAAAAPDTLCHRLVPRKLIAI